MTTSLHVIGRGILIALSLWLFPLAAWSGSVSYQIKWAGGRRVHVVAVNLKDQNMKVTPALAYGRAGRRQTFRGFLVSHRPMAQMTGAYFGLRDWLPIGDIVIDQHHLFDGAVGSALAVTRENTAEIIDVPYRQRRSWKAYESVMQGGIRLVRNKQLALSPYAQGFRDPGLFRSAARTAVGLTDSGRLLMVAASRGMQLSQLARVMRELGCRDAMTLDGGTSTGLAYGSKIIIAPGRPLSNVLMVVRRPRPAAPKPATAAPVQPSPPPTPTPAPVDPAVSAAGG